MIDEQRNEARLAEERRKVKLQVAQFRSDVQAVFGTVEGRRVLSAFLHNAGADQSTLRHDNLATGHAIGWQDAARWWLTALRAHCPEREVQMRAEAKREAAQGAPQDPDDE
jgi:hypothetical protein